MAFPLISFLGNLISGAASGIAQGAGAIGSGISQGANAIGGGLGGLEDLAQGGIGELLKSGDPKVMGALNKMGILPEGLLGGSAAPSTGVGASPAVAPIGPQGSAPAGGLTPDLSGLAPENPLTLTQPKPPMSLNQQPTLLGPLSPMDNPAAMEILPPTEQGNTAIDRSGGRKGLLGKYINTMEKVNDAMEATPILGHYLRSTPGELQERRLPAEMGQSSILAQHKGMIEGWKQQQANQRAEADRELREGIAEKRDAATDRRTGALMDAKDMDRAVKIAGQLENAGPEEQEILWGQLEEMDIKRPETDTPGTNWLEYVVQQIAQGAGYVWEKGRGLSEKGKKGGGKPPLSSFEK
jgi:hypothetical protein